MSGIFANFTSETATGTGNTLTLTGALTGLLEFSKSFNDGDSVSYVVKDSGGSIKVAGIGTYNSAGNTITRNDLWNFNGTVVDENPSTNITLSGGTHTASCDLDLRTVESLSQNARTSETRIMNGLLNSAPGAANYSLPVNQQRAHIFRLMKSAQIANLELAVLTTDAGGLASIGLSRCIDGISEDSYIANAVIDITTTGSKTISVNKFLIAGYYFCHLVTDSATAGFNASEGHDGRVIGWTPLRKTLFANRNSPCQSLSKNSVVSGILDSNPETVTSNSHADTSDRPLMFTLTRTI